MLDDLANLGMDRKILLSWHRLAPSTSPTFFFLTPPDVSCGNPHVKFRALPGLLRWRLRGPFYDVPFKISPLTQRPVRLGIALLPPLEQGVQALEFRSLALGFFFALGSGVGESQVVSDLGTERSQSARHLERFDGPGHIALFKHRAAQKVVGDKGLRS